jgi:hypothetical protein
MSGRAVTRHSSFGSPPSPRRRGRHIAKAVAPAASTNRKGAVTTTDLELLHDLYIARQQGKAGAVEPGYLPSAHRLAEKGWLERRFYRDDLVWWMTERAMVSLQLAGLERTTPADAN